MQCQLAIHCPLHRYAGTASARRTGQDRGIFATAAAAAAAAAGGGSNGAGQPRAIHATSPRINGASSLSTTPKAAAAAAASITAAVGGELVEPLNLSQLLQSNPNDLLAGLTMAGCRTSSLRSLAGLLDPGLAVGSGGVGGGVFPTASIITVSGLDNAASARQQLDLLVCSVHATINTDAGAGAAQ